MAALIQVHTGQRVTFKAKDGTVKEGTVQRVDEAKFPGLVYVKDDNGEIHEVPVHIRPV